MACAPEFSGGLLLAGEQAQLLDHSSLLQRDFFFFLEPLNCKRCCGHKMQFHVSAELANAQWVQDPGDGASAGAQE